jgi:hypothetical protein
MLIVRIEDYDGDTVPAYVAQHRPQKRALAKAAHAYYYDVWIWLFRWGQCYRFSLLFPEKQVIAAHAAALSVESVAHRLAPGQNRCGKTEVDPELLTGFGLRENVFHLAKKIFYIVQYVSHFITTEEMLKEKQEIKKKKKKT